MADAAPQVATERELKLSAWPEFTLPDLSGVIPGVRAVAAAETSLAAAYFDTVDLRLLRRGVTVRFRRGERGGDLWTVKLPEVATLGLARREISVAGAPGAMPRPLRDLTRGWTFGAPLERMATIRTSRRTIRSLAADDRPIALIDDDDVRGLRGRRVAARFRELEIELAPDTPSEALRALDRALRKAGALPAPQVPKLARTLGAPAGEPWDLAPPELGSRPTAAELLRRRLIGALAILVDQHAAFVLDDDRAAAALVEGIAQLRGDLRLFRPLLDMPDSADVERGLEQVSQDLTALCDQDAAMSTLRADAANARLGDAVHAVIDAIAHERAGCHEHAARLLRSARYGTLLGGLRQLALVPPVRPKAKRRDERTVPGVASSSVRALREQIRRTTPASPTTRTSSQKRRGICAMQSSSPRSSPASRPIAPHATSGSWWSSWTISAATARRSNAWVRSQRHPIPASRGRPGCSPVSRCSVPPRPPIGWRPRHVESIAEATGPGCPDPKLSGGQRDGDPPRARRAHDHRPPGALARRSDEPGETAAAATQVDRPAWAGSQPRRLLRHVSGDLRPRRGCLARPFVAVQPQDPPEGGTAATRGTDRVEEIIAPPAAANVPAMVELLGTLPRIGRKLSPQCRMDTRVRHQPVAARSGRVRPTLRGQCRQRLAVRRVRLGEHPRLVVAGQHHVDRLRRKLRRLQIGGDRRMTIQQVAELHDEPAPSAPATPVDDACRT
jgi:inorganic triphosphatase YgiF